MLKRILSLMLTAVLLLAVFISSNTFAEETADENIYYVYTENGRELNVRDAPNGEKIGSLTYGEEVRVKAFINDYWALISYKDDIPGYVSTRFLVPVAPDEIRKAIEEEQKYITGDPLMDIDAEFASAVDVEKYKITVRPARVTSVVGMRWIPSETGRVVAQYKATEELVVLKELEHYLLVQDPDTGDIGYIHKKFAAR